MEGSESEAIFDSYNLNPQLFINEVLNAVEDLVDGAFDFFLQKAPEVVGGETSTEKSEELARGVSALRNITQTVLDKRLSMWEKYCLQHCFVVPEGFSAETLDVSSNGAIAQDPLNDKELDDELQSLRDKIASAGIESTELQKEIQMLEKQSVLASNYDSSITEALQLHEKNSIRDKFQEIEKTAPIIHLKMKEWREGFELAMPGEMCSDRRLQAAEHQLGPSSKLEDLQHVVELLKNA